MPKTSVQMKNRYALKPCSENVTRLNWIGSTKFFFIKLNNDAFKMHTLGYSQTLYIFMSHHLFQARFFSWYVIIRNWKQIGGWKLAECGGRFHFIFVISGIQLIPISLLCFWARAENLPELPRWQPHFEFFRYLHSLRISLCSWRNILILSPQSLN
jgi:hypothetical protein